MQEEKSDLMSTFEMTESLLEDPDTRIPAATKLVELLCEEFQSYSTDARVLIVDRETIRVSSDVVGFERFGIDRDYQSCEKLIWYLLL